MLLKLHDIICLEPRSASNKSVYQNMGWYYRRFVVPKILPKCKKIITVSEFECNRIKDFLGLPENQIQHIYNGFSSHFKVLEDKKLEIKNKYIPEKEYIFFLGNTDPKKNLERTIKGYSLYLKESKQKLPLLIADFDKENLPAILKKLSLEDINQYIYCVKYIDNKDLSVIYNNATIFLYTSLRESFGIPMLESLSCGTPVIAGNTSSMPEIMGEGGVFADPYDEKDISGKLLLLENNPDLYQKQIEYGLDRVKKFSWRNTANELLRLYNSI